jgi:hypothetical protein
MKIETKALLHWLRDAITTLPYPTLEVLETFSPLRHTSPRAPILPLLDGLKTFAE